MILAKVLLVPDRMNLQKLKLLDETNTIKNAKITKRPRAYRGHVSIYNGEILNSFNREL